MSATNASTSTPTSTPTSTSTSTSTNKSTGQRNIELVQQIYQDFNAGAINSIIPLLANDLKWVVGEPGNKTVPWNGQGSSVSSFLTQFLGVLAEHTTSHVEAKHIAAGTQDEVISVAQSVLTGRQSGVSVTITEVHVFTFNEEGKIQTFQEIHESCVQATVLE